MELFDDNFFDDFVEDKDTNLDSEQKKFAKGFAKKLKSFFTARPRYPDPSVVLDDPEWRLIRSEAKALLEKLAL